jgi:hypothetical protein
MTALQSTLRRSLFLLVPFAAIFLLVGWQTDWGRTWHRVPPAPTIVAPPPLAAAVLPEYRANDTPETSRDFIGRSLFNPTRRPAPPAVVVAENAKPKLQRGQFALTGTLVTDGRATAFLRETNGGKSRRVAQGETINGMLVADVRADRIRLSVGDESEELPLKLATGPRTTVQPAPVAAATPPAGNPGGAASAQPRDVGEVLAERRRAAREAEAAAAASRGASGATPGATPPPPATTPPTAAAPVDPQWQSVFQRYQQPRR